MIVSLDTQYAGSRRMEDSVKKKQIFTREVCVFALLDTNSLMRKSSAGKRIK